MLTGRVKIMTDLIFNHCYLMKSAAIGVHSAKDKDESTQLTSRILETKNSLRAEKQHQLNFIFLKR